MAEIASESAKEPMKAHCPRCDGDRACNIHGQVYRPWTWTDGRHSAAGGDRHRLLECRGCETVFYWKTSWDDNDFDYDVDDQGDTILVSVIREESYPTPTKKDLKPDWTWALSEKDPQLGKILSEVYDAAERRSNILAAIGLRTAFDRVVKYHDIKEDQPLKAKVEALKLAGFIGETEAEILNVVVDAGSAAAHRGWDPSDERLNQLLQALEQLIHRTIVVGKQVLEVKALIPQRGGQPITETE